MKTSARNGAAMLLAGLAGYVLFMLAVTRIFDERWPNHPVEYLPLAAVVPVWIYRLLSPPR